VNPTINSRWGLLCPSCQTKLINPNKPWPLPCPVCGTRTHVGCLRATIRWVVDLDLSFNEHDIVNACDKCHKHADNNLILIDNIPHASGDQPINIYRRYVAKNPRPPKRNVINLWGDYYVDPDNFIPAVSKVLDIVHNTGPKVRWAVKLGYWTQIPMTNLASKEILLPNYFESPNALGRTHQEILDAMTGAAMHEAGHAAYDSASTIIEAQKRIKPGPHQSTWASATCLNIVCDYNLERKVVERYPAFLHYFTECHRWSVQDTLPSIVGSLKIDGAEDKLNVRLAVITWEMLGPGDLEAAGAPISPKLKWITQKCYDILKYAYTKGHLNTEPGKLKTARALYELIRVLDPVGAPPSGQQPTPPPQGQQPQPTTYGFPGQPGNQGQQSQPGQPGSSSQQGDDAGDPGEGSGGSPQGESEDTDDDSDVPESASEGPEDGEADAGSDSPGASADARDSDESPEGSSENDEAGEEEASGGKGQGSPDDARDASGTDPGEDGDSSQGDSDSDSDPEQEDSKEVQGQDDDDSGNPDNTDSEETDAGEPGSSSHQGGKSGSESGPPPGLDPFTGKGNLEDDPARRSNSKKDALDDLQEENQGRSKINEQYERPLHADQQMDGSARTNSEQASIRPDIAHLPIDKDMIPSMEKDHALRIQELQPVISRLKKVLRFRNADWGGRQTGRRAGTLTRRHVSRLSTLGSDKVFHRSRPDETPKVRIGLLIDESDSMRANGIIPPYIAARNAATALTQALKGIRGVKLWSWGYSMQRSGNLYQPNAPRHIPTMRQYGDPFHAVNPASVEAWPMFGGTPTGEAMDYAAEIITKNASPDETRVIFIITDGEAGGYIQTSTAVRKWWGKVTFVHIGIGNTKDPAIPYYVGPVLDTLLLPDMLEEAAAEILK
jgi:hypothetical protein